MLTKGRTSWARVRGAEYSARRNRLPGHDVGIRFSISEIPLPRLRAYSELRSLGISIDIAARDSEPIVHSWFEIRLPLRLSWLLERLHRRVLRPRFAIVEVDGASSSPEVVLVGLASHRREAEGRAARVVALYEAHGHTLRLEVLPYERYRGRCIARERTRG